VRKRPNQYFHVGYRIANNNGRRQVSLKQELLFEYEFPGVLGLAVDPIKPVNRETLILISYYLAS